MISGDNSDLAQITNFLASKGEGAVQIAGIEGNLEVESGFSPTASNSREGAIGIAQWENGRRTALDNYAARTGGSETSLATQEGFLWSELTGPYKSVLDTINAASDPATVAADWDVGPGGVNSGTGFENSSGSMTQQRINDARALYKQLSNGTIPTTATGTAGSTGTATGAQGVSASSILGIPSVTDIEHFALETVFVLAGAALVLVGLNRASNGSVGKAAKLGALAAV